MVGLRRSPMKRTTRRSDPVTEEVRAYVLRRDGECVLYKRDPFHICRDQWGNWHHAAHLSKLSLEHVKDELRAGKRAPSDPAHLVALCFHANVAVPSKDERQWMREYLEGVNA